LSGNLQRNRRPSGGLSHGYRDVLSVLLREGESFNDEFVRLDLPLCLDFKRADLYILREE
jgi:hypothetical protein